MLLAMPRSTDLLPKQALGIAVKRFRTKRKLTQEALAYGAGISLSTLARIETGAFEASLSTILLLAEALDTSAGTLVSECEEILRKTAG